MLAAVGGNELCLYDINENFHVSHRNTVRDFHRHNLTSLTWNHTNQVVAISGRESKISLVQVSNGSLLSTLPFNNDEAYIGETIAVAFSSNSRYLASTNARCVNLWDLKRRQLRASFTGHKGDVTKLGVGPDGNIAAGDAFGIVRLWDIKSGVCADTLSPPAGSEVDDSYGSVTALQVAPMGAPRVAVGYANNGKLTIWDMESSQLIKNIRAHTGAVTGLTYSPKNTRLVATSGNDGRICLWDTNQSTNNADASAFIDVGQNVTCLSFHSGAIHCAVGTSNGSIFTYDWRNASKPVSSIQAFAQYQVNDIGFQNPSPLDTGSLSPKQSRSPHRRTKGESSNPRSANKSHNPLRNSNESANSAISSLSASTINNLVGGTTIAGAAAPYGRSVFGDDSSLHSPPAPVVATPAAPVASNDDISNLLDDKNKDFDKAKMLNSDIVPTSASASSSVSNINTNRNSIDTTVLASIATEPNVITATSASTSIATHNNPAIVVVATPNGARVNSLNDGDMINTAAASEVEVEVEVDKDIAAQASLLLKQQTLTMKENQMQIELELQQERLHLKEQQQLLQQQQMQLQQERMSFSIAQQKEKEKEKEKKEKKEKERNISTHNADADTDYNSLRSKLQPVSSQEFHESLELLKYDFHKEIQTITREQLRQFEIQRDNLEGLVNGMKSQLDDLLLANKILRKENENLRNIY
jgi:WD40 repeat protein